MLKILCFDFLVEDSDAPFETGAESTESIGRGAGGADFGRSFVDEFVRAGLFCLGGGGLFSEVGRCLEVDLDALLDFLCGFALFCDLLGVLPFIDLFLVEPVDFAFPLGFLESLGLGEEVEFDAEGFEVEGAGFGVARERLERPLPILFKFWAETRGP